MCVGVGVCRCVCLYMWAELIAFGLSQTEFCQTDLHGVDDGEAAVPPLVWHYHSEASLWTLRYDVTGFNTHTQTHTHMQGGFKLTVPHHQRNSLLTPHATNWTYNNQG